MFPQDVLPEVIADLLENFPDDFVPENAADIGGLHRVAPAEDQLLLLGHRAVFLPGLEKHWDAYLVVLCVFVEDETATGLCSVAFIRPATGHLRAFYSDLSFDLLFMSAHSFRYHLHCLVHLREDDYLVLCKLYVLPINLVDLFLSVVHEDPQEIHQVSENKDHNDKPAKEQPNEEEKEQLAAASNFSDVPDHFEEDKGHH